MDVRPCLGRRQKGEVEKASTVKKGFGKAEKCPEATGATHMWEKSTARALGVGFNNHRGIMTKIREGKNQRKKGARTSLRRRRCRATESEENGLATEGKGAP